MAVQWGFLLAARSADRWVGWKAASRGMQRVVQSAAKTVVSTAAGSVVRMVHWWAVHLAEARDAWRAD
jgi:hypothetical protein